MLTSLLEDEQAGCISSLERAVDSTLAEKNRQRQIEGKAALQSYYRDFALLQEVTKAASRALCGEITVAHTSAEISPFSVTSFYEVGLALGLITAEEIMALHEP